MKPEIIKSKNDLNIKKFTQSKQILAQRPQEEHLNKMGLTIKTPERRH